MPCGSSGLRGRCKLDCSTAAQVAAGVHVPVAGSPKMFSLPENTIEQGRIFFLYK
jgi:hypothetical protein